MSLTNVQKVKLEVADIDPAFPILSDTDYSYFLEKNNNNVTRSAIDAARTILLVLSQRTDETVDIFSVRGSKAAEQYRLSLQMFLRDPSTNPVLQNCTGWVGGVSREDIIEKLANADGYAVTVPSTSPNPSVIYPANINPYF
jgi:hypothetical protein